MTTCSADPFQYGKIDSTVSHPLATPYSPPDPTLPPRTLLLHSQHRRQACCRPTEQGTPGSPRPSPDTGVSPPLVSLVSHSRLTTSQSRPARSPASQRARPLDNSMVHDLPRPQGPVRRHSPPQLPLARQLNAGHVPRRLRRRDSTERRPNRHWRLLPASVDPITRPARRPLASIRQHGHGGISPCGHVCPSCLAVGCRVQRRRQAVAGRYGGQSGDRASVHGAVVSGTWQSEA